MTPAERKRWQQQRFAELLAGLRVFGFLILPVLLIFLGITFVAPSYLWLSGVVLGAGAITFGAVQFARTPPGALLPANTRRDGRPSARQHHLVCIFGGILVVLICAWAGYVAL